MLRVFALYSQEFQISGKRRHRERKWHFFLSNLCAFQGQKPILSGTIFALEQNYPNPFNCGTVIRFALPVKTAVELAVFDLAGQKVATLMSGERQAETCTIQWDSRDDDGLEVASGVYLYRLRTGGQVQVRKLVKVE